MRRISMKKMMAYLVVAAIVGITSGAASAEANDFVGIKAIVNAPATVRVGEPVFVTVSIENSTDRNFDFRTKTGEVILPGGFLGSVGYSIMGEPNYWGVKAIELLCHYFQVRRHTTTVVGFASEAITFTEPGYYTVNSSFVLNDFQATLVDRMDPYNILDLVGASSAAIRVLPAQENTLDDIADAISELESNTAEIKEWIEKKKSFLKKISHHARKKGR